MYGSLNVVLLLVVLILTELFVYVKSMWSLLFLSVMIMPKYMLNVWLTFRSGIFAQRS